jgi:hypothetical protein
MILKSFELSLTEGPQAKKKTIYLKIEVFCGDDVVVVETEC